MAEESGSRWSQAAPPSSGYRADIETGRPTETSQDARNMAMLCHLLGAVGFFGPLVIWLIERDKHRFVDEHGRAAMNYQISIMIYLAALAITVIGAFLIPALAIIHIVLIAIGAVKASRGEPWLYPIAISFLKQPRPVAGENQMI
jgi:uncharacterized Tic20 family protein